MVIPWARVPIDQREAATQQHANPSHGFVPHNPGMQQTNSKAYQPLRVFRLEPSNLDSSVNILAPTVKHFIAFPLFVSSISFNSPAYM